MEEYKILIVEDVKAAHHLYEQALKSYNSAYEIKCVDRGLEALKEVKLNKYNLIILDMFLPDIRGEEVLEKIRGRGMDVPVLVLTAFSEKSLILKVTKHGIHDYLIKPVDLDDLRTRVSEILTGKKEMIVRETSKKNVESEVKPNKKKYPNIDMSFK